MQVEKGSLLNTPNCLIRCQTATLVEFAPNIASASNKLSYVKGKYVKPLFLLRIVRTHGNFI
ncbi:hypothetical protein ANCCAN_02290 [Ancylostoma caninum]|uniref:Uncharacterized protein n=1 Tax=Ancylostoma caninum TaxID=29170 RepID=A0A368H4T9_ANCCA|nr:hypothetical protein ANCCAN_02290 [Ancylostoma caninum]